MEKKKNAIGADLYNHTLTGDISMTLCCERSDPHHIPCVLTFNQISQSAVYRKDDVSVSLTVCGGSYGGGSECLVVDMV